jgi:hypothetical protein
MALIHPFVGIKSTGQKIFDPEVSRVEFRHCNERWKSPLGLVSIADHFAPTADQLPEFGRTDLIEINRFRDLACEKTRQFWELSEKGKRQ